MVCGIQTFKCNLCDFEPEMGTTSLYTVDQLACGENDRDALRAQSRSEARMRGTRGGYDDPVA